MAKTSPKIIGKVVKKAKGKNPKWVWYTEVNNPKQDEAIEAGG